MFVAVAEELNFRRAAERCHITQPALSRRIRRLEEELSITLFHRTKREVKLTEAGSAFLGPVREGLESIYSGARDLRRMSDTQNTLTLGAVEYANFPFLPEIMKRFNERHPDVPIVRRDLQPKEQVEALRRGELDVSFHGAPNRSKDLSYIPVMPARWSIALPTDHRLAESQDVALQDLEGEPLIMFPRFTNPELYDWIVRRLQEAGVEPRIVQESTQLHAALNLVAAGLGLFPTPFFLEDHRRDGIAIRKVPGFDIGVWVCAAYRKKDQSLLLQNFLDVVRQVREVAPDRDIPN